jgi:dUTP pyrophosphatase
METVTVAIMWLDPGQSADLPLPAYATELAAGMDVCAALAAPLVLAPGEIGLVGCGLPWPFRPGLKSRCGRDPAWRSNMVSP